jgi:hypothetical protein
MAQNGGAGVVWEGLPNLQRFYDWCRDQLMHPLVVPGISDAGAHMNVYCDASTPTAMLSFWSRDRYKGPQIPLEISVMKQARDTAYLYGLTDRGTIEVGKKADCNVINMETLQIHRPTTVHDLPLGKARWNQAVSGYDMTILNGVVTFEDGSHTGAYPGALIRKNALQRPAPADLPDPPARFSNYRTVLVGGSMTKDDALAQSLATEGGISNVSRIANAVEETKEETASDHDHNNMPEHTKLDPKL